MIDGFEAARAAGDTPETGGHPSPRAPAPLKILTDKQKASCQRADEVSAQIRELILEAKSLDIASDKFGEQLAVIRVIRSVQAKPDFSTLQFLLLHAILREASLMKKEGLIE